jgi:hypothetical protein
MKKVAGIRVKAQQWWLEVNRVITRERYSRVTVRVMAVIIISRLLLAARRADAESKSCTASLRRL